MAVYKRIGTSYYKAVEKPGLSGEIKTVLIPWSRQAIIDDHKKSYLRNVKKYEGFIVSPSHLNYRTMVHNFYNQYMPLSHDLELEYKEGSIPTTLNFLNHIFGDQIELGLDYLCIIWREPRQILPILCLVSEERNTGKTTFLNWLKLIFEENMTINKNEDFRSRFNSDWSDKIIIAVDEVLLNKREDSERIKNLSTSQVFKTESKGKDKIETPFYGKFILCSNFENNFILVDEREIRYWVRKVSEIDIINPDLVDELKNELPQFIAYLTSRKIQSPKKTRMWFTRDQIHTKALDNLVKGTKANLEKELLSIIDELIEEFEVQEVKLTINDLQQLIKDSYYKVSKFKITEIIKEKWRLESINSSYPFYHKIINSQTSEWEVSSTSKKGRCYTFSRKFIKSKLNC